MSTLKEALDGFRVASLTRRVAERFATEFPTEKARKKYLQDHPDADPKNHTVKKDEGGGGKKSELYKHSESGKKHYDAIAREAKKVRNLDGEKAQEALQKVTNSGNALHDVAVQVHKKLQGLKGNAASDEFGHLKKSLGKLEEALESAKDGSMPGFSASKVLEAAEDVHGDLHRIGALSLSGSV